MQKIKIKSNGQICFTDSSFNLTPGQEILVELDGIIEKANILCQKNCTKIKSDNTKEDEAKFLRLASEEDKALEERLKKIAANFLLKAKEKVSRHGLEMKILSADLSLDEKKLTFYFSATNRIDFRGLVSDMAGDFRKIIRLQQVGPRDEARFFGGFGKCGRELCCSKFFLDMDNISQDAASNENRNMKGAMFTGCCNKLMCCLSFENTKDAKAAPAKQNKKVL